MILFSGIHGGGKTTLANYLSQHMGYKVVPSRASEIAREFGSDQAKDVPLDTRLSIQEAILSDWSASYASAIESSEPSIFDRTPLDFATYLVADLPRELEPHQRARVDSYITACMNIMVTIPLFFIVTQHGQPEDIRDGKVRSDNFYYSLKWRATQFHLADPIGLRYELVGAGTVEERAQTVSYHLQQGFEEQTDEIIEERGEKVWQRPEFN